MSISLIITFRVEIDMRRCLDVRKVMISFQFARRELSLVFMGRKKTSDEHTWRMDEDEQPGQRRKCQKSLF